MFYSFTVVVPAGTTEDSPITQLLPLSHGIIHSIEVRFRAGTDFRVKCRLYYHESQAFPSNPGGELVEDGRAITSREHYPITTAPLELKVKAYSPTASYEHTIYIRIGVLPEWVLTPFRGLSGLFGKFFKMVGIR